MINVNIIKDKLVDIILTEISSLWTRCIVEYNCFNENLNSHTIIRCLFENYLIDLFNSLQEKTIDFEQLMEDCLDLKIIKSEWLEEDNEILATYNNYYLIK